MSIGTPSTYSMTMIGGSVGQGAAIEKMRDVRMIELGEDLPLDLEARLHSAAEGAAVHHLDGDLLLEFGVGALGEEDFAHAARTQGAQHAIRPYAIAFHGLQHAPAVQVGGKRRALLRLGAD